MVKAMVTEELRLERQAAVGARSASAQSAAVWIIGGLALVGAVVLASVLALVFAATAAVAMVLTLFLMAAAVLTQKSCRLTPVRAASADVRMVINARKVGHSWVAYGWDKDA